MAIGAATKLGMLISAITEGVDLIDVLYESLDDSVKQRGKLTPQEKLLIVLMNLEHIRPGTLVAEYLAEQFEDRAFGMLGKISKEAQQHVYNTVGAQIRPTLGPADTPPRPNMGPDPWLAEFNKLIAELF